jgi:signal transduction histidine kinase
VPKNVVGDSTRVMQVFTNLIGNSIKFTSQGRIAVRARLATLEEGVNTIRKHRRSFSSFSLDMFTEIPSSDEVVILFEVDDSGTGIEPGKGFLHFNPLGW